MSEKKKSVLLFVMIAKIYFFHQKENVISVQTDEVRGRLCSCSDSDDEMETFYIQPISAKSKENLVFDSKENPVEFYLEKCLDVEKNRRTWTKSFLESRRISLVSFAQKYIFPLVSEALWCLRPNTEIFRKRR